MGSSALSLAADLIVPLGTYTPKGGTPKGTPSIQGPMGHHLYHTLCVGGNVLAKG